MPFLNPSLKIYHDLTLHYTVVQCSSPRTPNEVKTEHALKQDTCGYGKFILSALCLSVHCDGPCAVILLFQWYFLSVLFNCLLNK